MRRRIVTILSAAGLALASQTVFSVHDDLLAFPQYEIVLYESIISDIDAQHLIDAAAQGSTMEYEEPSAANSIQSIDRKAAANGRQGDGPTKPLKETHEKLWLDGQQYLCSIPIVIIPPRNETSEAEARAEEHKELARAKDRGWELLQGLEGNCMYFVSGWWSYSFCYNSEVTQFHQLEAKPGHAFPPQRDPNTPAYVLGRAKPDNNNIINNQASEDEWGNQLDVRQGAKKPVAAAPSAPTTELQTKGDSRYLVQKMESGTICDLTNKPRRIEIQYHCNPHAADRIGYIKEVTTCSYLMVVHTPRLCNDVAFLPAKETRANIVACRQILPDADVAERRHQRSAAAELALKGGRRTAGHRGGEGNGDGNGDGDEEPAEAFVVGGVVVGGNKFVGKEGQRIAIPKNWAQKMQDPQVEVIATSKGGAEPGKVDALSDEELQKMDLDPDVIEELKAELEKLAGDRGWKLEVVDVPGDPREIRGIVEGDDDLMDDGEEEGDGYGEERKKGEGSEETYKDEL